MFEVRYKRALSGITFMQLLRCAAPPRGILLVELKLLYCPNRALHAFDRTARFHVLAS